MFIKPLDDPDRHACRRRWYPSGQFCRDAWRKCRPVVDVTVRVRSEDRDVASRYQATRARG